VGASGSRRLSAIDRVDEPLALVDAVVQIAMASLGKRINTTRDLHEQSAAVQ